MRSCSGERFLRGKGVRTGDRFLQNILSLGELLVPHEPVAIVIHKLHVRRRGLEKDLVQRNRFVRRSGLNVQTRQHAGDIRIFGVSGVGGFQERKGSLRFLLRAVDAGELGREGYVAWMGLQSLVERGFRFAKSGRTCLQTSEADAGLDLAGGLRQNPLVDSLGVGAIAGGGSNLRGEFAIVRSLRREFERLQELVPSGIVVFACVQPRQGTESQPFVAWVTYGCALRGGE